MALAASQAATTPSAAAAAVAAAAKDLRPVDIVRVFESQRASLAEELAVTKAENRVLEVQAARAREALHAAGLPVEGEELLEGRARAAVRQAAAAEERAARAEAEVAALRSELGSRPTAAALESLKRQLGIMERQLDKAAAKKEKSSAKASRQGLCWHQRGEPCSALFQTAQPPRLPTLLQRE